MPTVKVFTDLNLQSNKITGLPAAVANGEPVTYEQLNAQIEGLAWKDACRVATQSNINLSSPGSSVDAGITLDSLDRVLVRAQTDAAQNGIYLFDTGSSAMVRASDANTASELEQAVVTIEEGTSQGSTYRQSEVNFTLDTDDVIWVNFGTSAPSASETTAGILEIATQPETDTGTDNERAVTPLKLASSTLLPVEVSQTFGDGTSTQYDITHNIGHQKLHISVVEVATGDAVLCQTRHISNTVLRVFMLPAPASNAFRVDILAKKG